MRTREELNMINSVHQQTPKIYKGEGKEQIELESTRKKIRKITGISKYLS
jgi:hypothetical protein